MFLVFEFEFEFVSGVDLAPLLSSGVRFVLYQWLLFFIRLSLATSSSAVVPFRAAVRFCAHSRLLSFIRSVACRLSIAVIMFLVE